MWLCIGVTRTDNCLSEDVQRGGQWTLFVKQKRADLWESSSMSVFFLLLLLLLLIFIFYYVLLF